MERVAEELTGGKAQSVGQSFRGVTTISQLATLFAALLLGISFYWIATAEDTSQKREAELISKENLVDSCRPPAAWRSANVGQEFILHDRLRTGEDSRAAVRFGDSSVLRIDELTEAEILPPRVTSAKPTMDLKQGSAYFFSREKSREIHVQTPAANGAIRGTEFVLTVSANGSTSFTILDGEVEISNSLGSVLVKSGERSEIEPGGKPAKTVVTEAMDSAQWCFYYPGVFDLNDLALSSSEQDRLRESLLAYGQGDILRALEEYPRGRVPASPGEKIYRAGLFLVAGQVRKAQDLLHETEQGAPGREALLTLIAAVTLKEKSSSAPPQTATDWIAESYYRQSKSDLAGSLQAAERAANLDANSGFAWTRVAESQFNLGRVSEAKAALDKGLKLAARNPAAHALRGFVLSAENNLKDAKDAFETAIGLHSALGDAWLGRGLCLIKQGQIEAGRRDLLTAAALEPNRVTFRRYLSENFGIVGVGTTTATPKQRNPRREKTPTPKPRYVQTTPPPRPEITATPPPAPAQLVPAVQIGIGRGGHYTNPRPQPPRPPTSGQSQEGTTPKPRPTRPQRPPRAPPADQSQDGTILRPNYTPSPTGPDHSRDGTKPRPTYTPRPRHQPKPSTPSPIR